MDDKEIEQFVDAMCGFELEWLRKIIREGKESKGKESENKDNE